MLTQERLQKLFDRRVTVDGDNYKMLCPVHEEKSPSFCIHKDYLVVHCFGCGVKGSLTGFVQNYLGVNETQAQKLLGLTLLDLIDVRYNAIVPPSRLKSEIYPESWLAPFTKGVHKYVIERGLSVSTLVAAGSLYDHHRRYQVFPHRSRRGDLVGAIGRACGGQVPKWYFYWGYEKGSHIYSLPGQYFGCSNPVWVVEGVFDVLWLYQHGIRGVSTQGSKPTSVQIEQLKEYDNLIIAYDNDLAGETGAKYLYDKLKRSATLSFPIWPDGVNDIMDVEQPIELQLQNNAQRSLRCP